jgi:putative transposase
VILSDDQRSALEVLVRRHSTPQPVALRARIIMLAAEGRNNSQIAAQVGLARESVRLWRDRWATLQALPPADLRVEDRLADAPRPGAPARISAEQVCQILALACAAPQTSGRPITQWTSREVADEIMARGIVAHISPRHAARLLKRGISSRTGCATG